MTIVQHTKKLTCKQADVFSDNSLSVLNIGDEAARDAYFEFVQIFLKSNPPIVEKFDKPLIIVREYESSPGLWMFEDTDTKVIFLLWSDSWKKHPWKGTRYDVIVDHSNINLLENSCDRFVKYFKEKLK